MTNDRNKARISVKMKVSEVYKKFGIPPNLQEHMLRVYSLVEFL